MGLLRCFVIFPIVAFFFPGLVPARVFRLHMAAGWGNGQKGGVRDIYFWDASFYNLSIFRECGETWGRKINKTEHGLA